jgi:hypothetical protein
MFERSAQFGGGLFALAASVMTDLMHHDPLIFPQLDAAGLPEAFLAAIKVRPAGPDFAGALNTAACNAFRALRGRQRHVAHMAALSQFTVFQRLASWKQLDAFQACAPPFWQ